MALPHLLIILGSYHIVIESSFIYIKKFDILNTDYNSCNKTTFSNYLSYFP